MDAPITYIKEGNKIIAKEAPIVEHQCWWCRNPFMYEIRKPGVYVEELISYQCLNCQAKQDYYGLIRVTGKEEKKEKQA
jgi:hypothetical protein